MKKSFLLLSVVLAATGCGDFSDQVQVTVDAFTREDVALSDLNAHLTIRGEVPTRIYLQKWRTEFRNAINQLLALRDDWKDADQKTKDKFQNDMNLIHAKLDTVLSMSNRIVIRVPIWDVFMDNKTDWTAPPFSGESYPAYAGRLINDIKEDFNRAKDNYLALYGTSAPNGQLQISTEEDRDLVDAQPLCHQVFQQVALRHASHIGDLGGDVSFCETFSQKYCAHQMNIQTCLAPRLSTEIKCSKDRVVSESRQVQDGCEVFDPETGVCRRHHYHTETTTHIENDYPNWMVDAIRVCISDEAIVR